MEIGNIVLGHVNELLGLNRDLKEIRLQICLKCPLYSPKFGGVCNNKIWLNPKTDEISFTERPGFIKGCGCRLLAKTTLANEQCPVGKW